MTENVVTQAQCPFVDFACHVGIQKSYHDDFRKACLRIREHHEKPTRYSLAPVMRYGETRHETPVYIKGENEDLVLIGQRIRWFMGCHAKEARIHSPILHLSADANQIIDHGYGKIVQLKGLRRTPYVTLRKRRPILEAVA